jgi:hypothetical protein
MKKIVADASSLILLAKVGALETITGRLVCLTAGIEGELLCAVTNTFLLPSL